MKVFTRASAERRLGGFLPGAFWKIHVYTEHCAWSYRTKIRSDSNFDLEVPGMSVNILVGRGGGGWECRNWALSMAKCGTAFAVVCYIPSLPLDLQQH